MSTTAVSWLAGAFFALCAAAASAPPKQTLDQLRADLSHEMAAKLARATGFLREWRDGRFRPADAVDAVAVVQEIRRLHLRHARLAAASFVSFGQLIWVLESAGRLQASLAAAARGSAADAPAVARSERLLRVLTARSRRLTETLSVRHGVRFAELVGAAAEEIRREATNVGGRDVPVELDLADGGVVTWIPRSDAARWLDLLRNLMRNALQATEERAAERTQDLGADGAACISTPVAIRLRPATGRGGTCVEILDDGVGMSIEQVASMWHDGRSRHGAGHGQGLTAAKRAFLEERADVEIRSLPGVGTCVRLNIPARDVTFRVPPRWAAAPLILPTALAATLLVGVILRRVHPELESIRVEDRLVVALDRAGDPIWTETMEDAVVPNWRSVINSSDQASTNSTRVPPVVVRDRRGQALAIIPTAPQQGPGLLTAFDKRGRIRWRYPLATRTPLMSPAESHAQKLIPIFAAATVWNEGGAPVIVTGVRDDNWGPTAIQFLSDQGRLLAEYLHPGTLEFFGSGDFDGDGHVEVILNGDNNSARKARAFWSGPPLDSGVYVKCLLMLETPKVGGQAFPYLRWAGAPPAGEEAYLLIPPLREADFADPHATDIVRLPMSRPDTTGAVGMEMYLEDGRIYRLDSRLRPLSCGVGDNTLAARLAPTQPAAPLLYFRDGLMERINLIVQRGS